MGCVIPYASLQMLFFVAATVLIPLLGLSHFSCTRLLILWLTDFVSVEASVCSDRIITGTSILKSSDGTHDINLTSFTCAQDIQRREPASLPYFDVEFEPEKRSAAQCTTSPCLCGVACEYFVTSFRIGSTPPH